MHMLRPLLVFVLTFTFLGLADSWYLAQSALTDTALTCNIAGLSGCNVVAQSAYSHLFGIPLGVYGVVFYALVFVCTALLFLHRSRFLFRSLFGLGLIGLIGSTIFVALQIFVIQALCIYCLASGAISFVIFLLTTLLWTRFTPPNVVSIPTIPLPPEA